MKKLKHWLFNWLLKSVYKAPIVEEVFTNLSQEQRENYAQEAKLMVEGKFYPEFMKLMEQLAVTKMARESNTSMDMLFGKALLFYVMTQRTKLKEFANYEKPKEGEPIKW